MKSFIAAVLVCFIMPVFAQSDIDGYWVTIDDETNKPKSIVELKVVQGKVEGTIVKLYPRSGRPDDPVCEECEDHRKGKKIVGMKIVEGLYKKGSEYKGGEILDPANGKIYSCKIWLSDSNKNQLNVRGYLGPFYRTQKWIRFTGKND